MPDPTNVDAERVPGLVRRLLQSAAGSPGKRAAVRLLVAHDVWLDDSRFVAACIESVPSETWVTWSSVRRFVATTRCPPLDREVLLLAVELAEAENARRFHEGAVFGQLDEEVRRRWERAIEITDHRGRRPEPVRSPPAGGRHR
jgi:hypothetical protein